MTEPLVLKRPLIFFDLESTGLDYKFDRIIEIGAVKVFPDGRQEKLLKRVNPGMRIPAEITTLTGISNEDVAAAAPFAELVDEIEQFFDKSDVGGYNIARFDIKMMVEEFKRVGRDFTPDDRAVVDAQVILHQKEKRDLAAAYKYYCGKDLLNAHSAQADSDATHEIVLAQIQRYTDLPRDVQGLHAFCRMDRERYVDSEGKFIWRDGEAVLNFGKFRSMSLKQLAEKHPEYLDWIVSPERHFGQDVIDLCYNAMQGRFPKKP